MQINLFDFAFWQTNLSFCTVIAFFPLCILLWLYAQLGGRGERFLGISEQPVVDGFSCGKEIGNEEMS